MMAAMQQTPGEVAEFTLKAIVVGIVLGIVFGAANAYLGLRVGMTVSASIPAAVMTVAVFSLMRSRGTLLEANMSQTVASASTFGKSSSRFTEGPPERSPRRRHDSYPIAWRGFRRCRLLPAAALHPAHFQEK